MKFIMVLGLAALTLILISLADADVGIDVSCYNSDEDLSLSLDAENIDYLGTFKLEPDGISFKNKGESTAPNNRYYLNQNFNRKSEISSAQTDSGSYKWAAQMETAKGTGEKFAIAASHDVDNGYLCSQYANDEIRVLSNVIASEASYSEKISVSENRLLAKGSGSTYFQDIPNLDLGLDSEPVFSDGILVMSGRYYHAERGGPSPDANSDQDPDDAGIGSNEPDQLPTDTGILAGFVQEIDVVGKDNWAHLKGATIGVSDDAVVKWNYGLKSGSDFQVEKYPYSFGLAVEGVSKKGFEYPGMVGEGSDIPMQYLPPGRMTMEFVGDNDSILFDMKTDEYLEVVNKETNEFYKNYPSPEDERPVAWYLWNQMAFVPSAEIDDGDLNSEENKFEHLKMNMLFDVNSDQSIEDGTPSQESSHKSKKIMEKEKNAS